MTTLSQSFEQAVTAPPAVNDLTTQLLPLARELETRLPPEVRDILLNDGVGHPLHPVLIHLPLGGWILAAALDFWPGAGHEQAADRVLLLGTLGAVPTVAAGWTEWTWRPMSRQARNTATVHGLAEETALFLNVASLVARHRGQRALGKALSLAGLGLALAGGMLGGQLVYGHGVGMAGRK
ncbi:DUF2231 domain-containing protein [Deinococcus sp.]|uniref:DUF2231 domain-containing protein n=1 Tax=Deinococcus sp. TaxID=47478 RepID=UPI0025BF005B|nr:DUF2231 domain-containing protein [Deinococcus sp.]